MRATLAGSFGSSANSCLCGDPLGTEQKSAAAGAQIAEDHKGGGAAGKTLVHIGTARRLTNGVQVQPAKLRFQGVNFFEVRCVLAKPLGQARMRGRAGFELNQRIGLQLSIFARSDS